MILDLCSICFEPCIVTGEQAREDSDVRVQVTALRGWPWYPLSLRFTVPEVEAAAIQDRNATCGGIFPTTKEAVYFSLGLIAVSVLIQAGSVVTSGLEITLVSSLAVSYSMGMVLAFLLALGISVRYVHWRTVVVIAARSGGFALAMAAGSPPQEAPTLLSALTWLLGKSPVMYTALSYLVWPLRMQRLLWVLLVSLLCYWVFSTDKFCELEDPSAMWMGFSAVGRLVDRILELSLFGGVNLDDGHRATCRAVAGFFFLFPGILLPAGIAYCHEVIWRAAFLRRVSDPKLHLRINEFQRVCLESIMWLAVFGMQVGWIVLRKV